MILDHYLISMNVVFSNQVWSTDSDWNFVRKRMNWREEEDWKNYQIGNTTNLSVIKGTEDAPKSVTIRLKLLIIELIGNFSSKFVWWKSLNRIRWDNWWISLDRVSNESWGHVGEKGVLQFFLSINTQIQSDTNYRIYLNGM